VENLELAIIIEVQKPLIIYRANNLFISQLSSRANFHFQRRNSMFASCYVLKMNQKTADFKFTYVYR